MGGRQVKAEVKKIELDDLTSKTNMTTGYTNGYTWRHSSLSSSSPSAASSQWLMIRGTAEDKYRPKRYPTERLYRAREYERIRGFR